MSLIPSPSAAPRPDAEPGEVLAWALDVATRGPAEAAAPPKRLTPAQWRALEGTFVRDRIEEILIAKHVEEGLDALEGVGVLDVWLPEVAAMVGFGDGEWRHKDVWKHSKQVVRQSARRPHLRWAALLHDIGKPKTRSFDSRGNVHFHGHAEVGAAMFRKRLSKRLGFEGALYERVHFLIKHHLRPSQYDESWTDSAVRRFYREMGDGLGDLLLLSRADITTKRPWRRRRLIRQITELQERVRKLQEQDAKVAPLPKGLGNLLMERFGLPPSRKIGDIRRQLERDVEEGRLEAQRDPEYYVAHIDAHRDRFGI